MKNASGLWLEITTQHVAVERGQRDWRITQPEPFGLQLGLVWGPLRRPVKEATDHNPWFDKDATVWSLPFVVLPWLHVWWRLPKADHPGRLYLGGKLFKADRPTPDSLGDPWARDNEYERVFVCPSASFRTGR